MSSEINKPTGLGYHSVRRLCGNCGHVEQCHYEGSCYEPPVTPMDDLCMCEGFTSREMTEEEKRIVAEQKQIARELELGDEALIAEVKREVKRRGG